MRGWCSLLVLVAAAVAGAACAAEPAAAPPPARAPVDYAQDANWLCRPGRTDACAIDLNASAMDTKGVSTPKPVAAATDAAVDCFYVYPTVSKQKTDFADLSQDEAILNVVHVQAARFTAKCRVFAPVYRQVTLAGLNRSLAPGGPKLDLAPAYEDVRDAWRRYLAHDNGGRGVVLVGHSQGSLLLAQLLAEEIEGKPAQKLLVSALLAGHPAIVVPQGKDVGGTFRSTPLCRSATQTGCVVVYSSYLEDDARTPRFFANNPGNGLVAACVNPAALGGGSAALDAYLRKPPMAPESAPPWVEAVGQMTGECVSDAAGTVLRVHVVEPAVYGGLLKTYLTRMSPFPGWGLHLLDINLVQGDLVGLVGTQGAAWAARAK